MEICYAYDGIGRVIVEMTASDWAAWVGTIGALAAVWAAYWLYYRTRRDAKTDTIARRKVLHAILREHVIQAGRSVAESVERIGQVGKSVERFQLQLDMILLGLNRAKRLIELQDKLLEFGEGGDDAAIAAFIESCRHYHEAHEFWYQQVKNEEKDVQTDKDGIPFALTGIRVHLDRLAQTVGPALAAIDRLDRS